MLEQSFLNSHCAKVIRTGSRPSFMEIKTIKEEAQRSSRWHVQVLPLLLGEFTNCPMRKSPPHIDR